MKSNRRALVMLGAWLVLIAVNFLIHIYGSDLDEAFWSGLVLGLGLAWLVTDAYWSRRWRATVAAHRVMHRIDIRRAYDLGREGADFSDVERRS